MQDNKTAFRQFTQQETLQPSNVSTWKSEAGYNLCKCLIVCLGMKKYSVQTGFITLSFITLRNNMMVTWRWCHVRNEQAFMFWSMSCKQLWAVWIVFRLQYSTDAPNNQLHILTWRRSCVQSAHKIPELYLIQAATFTLLFVVPLF